MGTELNIEDKGKKEQVRLMFNNIAGRYDFLNHFLSLGIDKCWRRTLIRKMNKFNPANILDIATGTADLAIAAAKNHHGKITGIDIAEEMLAIGRLKVEKRNLQKKIDLQCADSENLPFADNSFDAVMVAFGVRNFGNLTKGMDEMYRVLKPGGHVYILEFSKPQKFPVKQLFGFYFNNILPVLGRLVSRDMAAYTYLPESVGAFPSGQEFIEILKRAGLSQTEGQQLTFGVATLYSGQK
ncbi:MAG: bifunctional demethylmenaquinone methyltransferase/2-methoxy-6-polyprenyl-1,4-benzoquinol methylase UbiE [Bacteroidales bacterium]